MTREQFDRIETWILSTMDTLSEAEDQVKNLYSELGHLRLELHKETYGETEVDSQSTSPR